jgi:hypothetical protein
VVGATSGRTEVPDLGCAHTAVAACYRGISSIITDAVHAELAGAVQHVC